MIMNTETHGILGQSTTYPKTYSPDVLYPIPRSLGRRQLALAADRLSIGIDWWHVFELSWLNPQGISQVAMARLAIPATSEYIIESKSLKLYFNSLNFTQFDSEQAVKETVEKDLSDCLTADIKIEIFDVSDAQALPLYQPNGKLIDDAFDGTSKNIAIVDDVDSGLLRWQDSEQPFSQRQIFHSHLLRSNCPVTNQPDWGTVLIDIHAPKIDEQSLLAYLLSYRNHNGFHEQCVEQIFSDLTMAFSPAKLLVRAWYTRRGGIDINPCRVSDISLLPTPSRVNRQ